MAGKNGLENVMVFAGTDDDGYVDDVCDILGIKRSEWEFKYFSDSDPYARLRDNVGGKDVYFISRFHKRTTHNWVQMLLFANAALNESANSVNVFETYMGCSRQERKSKTGEAVSLQVKANSIKSAGVRNFSTFAAHAEATILGFDPALSRFLNFPLWPAMIRVMYNITEEDANVKLVGPDAGAAKAVRDILDSTTVQEDERFAKDLAIVDKDRVHVQDGGTRSGALVGDVNGYVAGLLDDESVSAASIVDAASNCRANGAVGVYAGMAHPKFFLDDNGLEKMAEALHDGIIDKLVTTNSCYLPEDLDEKLGLKPSSGKVFVISTQPLVAEYIRRTSENEGVPYLYSSRGVLGPYERIASRLKTVERSKRDEGYECRFKDELKRYRRLAETVLGPYTPLVRSHKKLPGTCD